MNPLSTAEIASPQAGPPPRVAVDLRVLLAPAIGLAAALLWLAGGASAADCAVYLMYIAAWVVMPGCLLALALYGVPEGTMELVVVGAALGFAQVVLGFTIAAMSGWRELSFLLPLASAGLCALWVVRRRLVRLSFDRRLPEPRNTIILGGLIALLLTMTAVGQFPAHPLPTQPGFSGATYYVDLPWHIGNAASLKTFWPPQDLRVAGEALPYYFGVYAQDAHASLLTHLELTVLMLRFDPLLFLALIALGLYWLGRTALRSATGGLSVLVLALLVGDLSIALAAPRVVFGNGFASTLYISPTYALGLVFFVPLLVLCGRWLSTSAARGGVLAAASLLFVAAALTKANVVPVLMAGAAGTFGWQLLRTRRANWRCLVIIGVGALAIGLTGPLVVAGTYAGTTSFKPLDSLFTTAAWSSYGLRLFGDSAAGRAVRLAFVIVGFAPLLLVGLAALLGATRLKLDDLQVWLLMVGASGAAAVLLFSWPGGGQWYFWYYAYVALVVLAAAGLRSVFGQARPRRRRLAGSSIALVGLIGFGTMLTPAAIGARSLLHPASSREPELSAGLVPALLWLRSHTRPTDVIAVNNYRLLAAPTRPYRYFYYSALTERPILLEGFAYAYASPAAIQSVDDAYPERRDLIERIFGAGDAAAIRTAQAKYGARYLLRDKRLPTRQHDFAGAPVRRVFGSADADVFEILPASPDGSS